MGDIRLKWISFKRRAKKALFILGVLFGFYLLVNSQLAFLMFLQILLAAAYLLFWVGFQMYLFYWFLSKGKKELYLPGQGPGYTWDDYLGHPKLKETIRQWVLMVRGMRELRNMGGEPPKGMLLVGPPGSGKTFLAKVLASSAGIPFLGMSGAQLTSAWFGVGAMKVFFTFRQARALARDYGACLVYIDEIDSIAHSRLMRDPRQPRMSPLLAQFVLAGGGVGGIELSALLSELDGLGEMPWLTKQIHGFLRLFGIKLKWKPPQIFCFGSTNVPEVIDPALKRPGRLSREVVIDLPDRDGRREILLGYLRKIKHKDIDVEAVLDAMGPQTPAFIAMLVLEEGPRKALFAGRNYVTTQDLLSALREIEVGIRNPVGSLSQKDREALAVHEAGHALLEWLLTDNRVSVTIVRYGTTLGHSRGVPTQEYLTKSLKELWVDAVVTCGGRAAELVVYGEPLVSVGGDYPHAMARLQALLDFGIWGAPIVNERERGRAISYLFEKAIDTAKAIISSHSGEHWTLVQALLKSEELEHEDIASVLGGRRKLEVEIPPKPSRGDEDEGEDR